jgi:hypothetical protein
MFSHNVFLSETLKDQAFRFLCTSPSLMAKCHLTLSLNHPQCIRNLILPIALALCPVASHGGIMAEFVPFPAVP